MNESIRAREVRAVFPDGTTEIMQGITEVLCYGTAVIVEPAGPQAIK